MSKETRFTSSKYDDSFRTPDGATARTEPFNEPVIKTCRYIDDYHTKTGSELFHTCQFAETMERVGAKYYPEDEIMDEQTAWKVSQNHYLASQTSEDGYDYILYDKNSNEIDGGQFDDPEPTMKEARKEILDDFKLGRKDLVAIDYDDLLEKMEQIETKQISSVLERLENRRQPILGNKQPSEMFFGEERQREL